MSNTNKNAGIAKNTSSPASSLQLVVITGLSGSGKSVALKVLEDSAYHATDNLPAELLPELVDALARSGQKRIVVSIDSRSGDTLSQLPKQITELRARGVDVRVLFLEAQTEILIKRFSETRRRHPLSIASNNDLTISEAVERERELLEDIGEIANHIDTSDLNPNALRAWVKQFIEFDTANLTLIFQSFGFKHGIPLDADFVFDVRPLPNPFYNPTLRPLTGRDAAVITFLENEPSVKRMYADIRNFVEQWLPAFVADNRHYLTVAIGCTGGMHRSVYFAETLAKHFGAKQRVLVRHRELPQ